MRKIKNNYHKYFEIGNGNVPIILSCPHGGFKKPKIIPDKEKGFMIPDRFTLFLSKKIINELKSKNINIYYIINKIHRSKIDLNRPPRSEVAFKQSSRIAKKIHYFFHKKIQELADKCISFYNRCLFIDFHGFTKPDPEYRDIIFGNVFSNTLKIKSESYSQENNFYWGFSNLVEQLNKHFSLDDGLGVNNLNIAYSGGYITHQFYGKEKINAFQIEIADNIRNDLDSANIFIEDFVKALIDSVI